MNDSISISVSSLTTFIGRMIPQLDEQQRRLFTGALVDAVGRGGLKLVSQITGMSQTTLAKGRNECDSLVCDPGIRKKSGAAGRIRREGGGRKALTENYPEIDAAIEKLTDGHVVGNPENPLCWTTKSTYSLAKLLHDQNIHVSAQSVGKRLKALGFSLQQNRKYVEKGSDSPDRNKQFELINEQCKIFQNQGLPVISVDTKKKELVGNYKNGGREYRRTGDPRLVNGHDFEGEGGKAAPYGIYDINADEGFVNVGISADTAEFAVSSILRWWETMGVKRYPEAKKLMITADCGGSNSVRAKLWKVELQKLADRTGLEIQVSHFPPGTSKWNKIEHRLFAQISRNWRGQPLESLAVIVSLIASTTTAAGLRVQCELDENEYQRGIRISDEDIAKVNLNRNAWRGDWNYTIKPHSEHS